MKIVLRTPFGHCLRQEPARPSVADLEFYREQHEISLIGRTPKHGITLLVVTGDSPWSREWWTLEAA